MIYAFSQWITGKLAPVVLLLSLSFLFLHGSLYRLLTPELVTRDAYGLFPQIKDIRDNGHQLTTGQLPSDTAIEHPYTHSVLLEWLLSFVPERHLSTVDRYFSGLMDVVFFGVLGLLVPLDILSLKRLALVLILFVSTPEFLRPEMPHSRGLSGRKFALSLTTLALLLFLSWHEIGDIVLLGAALLVGGLVFPSSKFAVQAFLAITIGLALLFDPLSLLYLASSLLVAIGITYGNYLKNLRTHIRFSTDFALHKQTIFNPLDPYLLVPSPPLTSMFDFLEYAYENKPLKILFNNPLVVAVVVLVVTSRLTGTTVSIPPGFGAWIISGAAAGILTALPGIRFLGGSERYFEYIFLPSAVFLVNATTAFGEWGLWVFTAVVFAGFIVQSVYVWTYLNVFTPSEETRKHKSALVDFLDGHDEGVLHSQPRIILRELNWKTKHKVVDLLGNNASTEAAVEEEQRLSPRREVMFNLTTADTGWLADQYDPDWVVFDLARLSTQNNFEDLDDYPNLLSIPDIPPDFRNDSYEVYSFDRLRDAFEQDYSNEVDAAPPETSGSGSNT